MGSLINKLKANGLVAEEKASIQDLYDLDLADPEDYVFFQTRALLQQLHNLMIEKKITRAKLARLMRVSNQAVSKSLSGKAVSISWLLKAIYILGGVADLRLIFPEKDASASLSGNCISTFPLSKLIKTLRLKANLLEKNLAHESRLTLSQIQGIENEERTATLSQLKRIARSLHVPFGVLAMAK